jgi:hypothetical protein
VGDGGAPAPVTVDLVGVTEGKMKVVDEGGVGEDVTGRRNVDVVDCEVRR